MEVTLASRIAGRLAFQGPILRWGLSYPLLLLIAALMLGFAWRVVASPFGIPDLFWHEDVSTQCVAGFASGLLLLDLGAVGCLLDAFRWEGSRGLKWPGLTPAGALFVWYLSVTSAPLWLALALGFVTVPEGVPRWPFPTTALAALIGGAALTLFLGKHLSKPAERRLPAFLRRQLREAVSDSDLVALHAMAYHYFLFRIALLVILWSGWAIGLSAPVALIITLLLSLATSAYGYVRFHFKDYSFGVTAGAGLLVVVGNAVIGGHELVDLERGRRDAAAVEALTPMEAGLLPDSSVLEEWLRARRSGDPSRKPPLVVVAADGGGIRAAVWTIAVLTQLELDVPDLPYSMRVVTGASGGMLGAGFYVASLTEPGDTSRHRDRFGIPVSRMESIRRMGADSLTPVAQALLFHDMPLVPMLFGPDRGESLQKAWEEQTRCLAEPFVALGKGEAAGWRPSLLISPVIVEDGRRLIFSNLDLHGLASIPVPTNPPLSSREDIEFLRMFREGRRLRLSTALRLNATFPYVTPAAELPTKPARRVMDAGYYDDHGVDLAASWIWMEREWLKANVSGVLLIQVPSSRVAEAKATPRAEKRRWWTRGVAEFIGPVEALLSTRDSAMAFRNDRIVRFLADAFSGTSCDFKTLVFEPEPLVAPKSLLDRFLRDDATKPREIALSWRLTREELRRLSGAICDDGCLARRLELQKWWGEHGGTRPGAPARCERLGL